MNRIYFSTNPYSFSAAVNPDWLWASLQDIGKKDQDEKARYDDLIGNWGGEPVLGYDSSKNLFEPAKPDSTFELYLVNDCLESPLEGFAIDKGDFLVFHDRTVKRGIKDKFSPDKIKPSHHIPNPQESDYNLAYSILSDSQGDKVKRIINAIFPSKEQKKKTIALFIARLHHKKLPLLPKELASLKDRYNNFSELSPSGITAFVDECIIIMDAQ